MEKGKVLAIDDEDIVLKSVKKILAEENYEVDVSSIGRQGIDWAIFRRRFKNVLRWQDSPS